MKGKLLPRNSRPPSAPRRTFRDAQKAGVMSAHERKAARPKRTGPWVSNRKAEWKDSDSIALAYKRGAADDS